MRKKLFLYNIIILVFTLFIVTFLFMKIVNKEYEENLKQNLKRNSILVSNLLNFNHEDKTIDILKEEFKNCDFRITYINKNGVVLYDNDVDPKKLDNHNKRTEVIEARKNGEGYSIRYSDSLKKNIIYYAYRRNDGTIIRSAMQISYVNSFKRIYLKYYMGVVAVSGLVAMLLSFKLSNRITSPIKDLEFITSAIAKGELEGRVKVSSNDEISDLGRTFNNMADKLQSTIMDSMEKQNKLEAILESMDSGVIAVDRKNNVIMINPYAEKIFGIEKNIIGLKLIDNIRNYDLENIFREKSKKYKELKIVWPTERILRVKTADIINGYECIGIVAVFQDITDMKKLENMRTQFVANVSHELKTPLTSIKGFAETIRYVDDDKERNEFLDIIDNEVDRLTRLIGDILVLSDIEINTDIQKEKIDVKVCITEVYNLLKDTAGKKNIEIKIECAEGPMITGDIDKFKQIIINLTDNAIKYSESGDKVFIGSKYENNKCIIWVEDTGVGIPEKDIPRLFETFYRVDKARSRAKGGTGLGLAIVKHIVMNFKGTIEIESALNRGSKFTVTLPIS
ncbi:two-component system histidine kinase PnpS [Clostridium guangxiense]|uniref:two-component system histidine kinase PnpS n=1 Tax=Clostridium guangxiense TaxID=1662055 RepID=UPI001E39573D|nr:ATP-binding protein [Clostridium guangxiense]MCD2346054.1 cell wall metabolism sensor histidine kinase WalK [Clostridium guangxiense]